MKRVFILSGCILLILFCLTSCSQRKTEETTDAAETTEASAWSSEDNTLSEDYSLTFSEPYFDFPSELSEFEDFVLKEEYDDKKTDGLNEKFYKSGVLIYEKEYNSDGQIIKIAVYTSDGKTVADTYDYKYTDNQETEIDIHYLNGNRRKYSFYSVGTIKQIYDMTIDAESGSYNVNSYEYNEKGELVNGVNSDFFNQQLLDAIINSLAG